MKNGRNFIGDIAAILRNLLRFGEKLENNVIEKSVVVGKKGQGAIRSLVLLGGAEGPGNLERRDFPLGR